MGIPTPTTRQKALALNLDARTYGTFAEIGGGQEVARSFFAAGGAAGTVAKSISAYDKAVSDILYGTAKRYVSRERLEAMLAFEDDPSWERMVPPKVAEIIKANRLFRRRQDRQAGSREQS